MHTSACTSFMIILHTDQTLRTHAKGRQPSSRQPAQMPLTAGTDKLGALYTNSLRLPTILFTFSYYFQF